VRVKPLNPPEFVAVTTYSVGALGELGVPETTPVDELKLSPLGKDGEMLQLETDPPETVG